jgi:hypothetical protein
VSTAAAALEACSARGFELIVCDVMMPETDGIALYEALSKARPHLCQRVSSVSAEGRSSGAPQLALGVGISTAWCFTAIDPCDQCLTSRTFSDIAFPHVIFACYVTAVYARNVERGVIRIALPYACEDEFLKAELELLGRSGTLLRGVEAAPESTVAFELVLTTGAPVLRGEGRILGHVPTRSGERGAVIRFTRLERNSLELVEYATGLLAKDRVRRARLDRAASSAAPTKAAQWLSEESWNAANRAVPLAPSAVTEPAVRHHSEVESWVAGHSDAISDDAAGDVSKPLAAPSGDQVLRKLRNLMFRDDPKAAPSQGITQSTKQESAGPMPAQEAIQEKFVADSSSNGLYLVAGSKGGVGKSMVTIALVDLLREQGKHVFLVECDNSNPDVWRAHKSELRSELVNLDDADGWIRLLNICDSNRDHVVVVNTAARNNDAVARFGSTLNDSLDELGRPLVTFWVINRQRDSLELLREFTTAIPRSVVHVVRNGYFGEERKFELYNSSTTRASIESKGGKSITFADLADRVADDLYSKHLSILTATRTLPLGNRAELSRWRGEVKKQFAGLLEGV